VNTTPGLDINYKKQKACTLLGLILWPKPERDIRPSPGLATLVAMIPIVFTTAMALVVGIALYLNVLMTWLCKQ
jgi:hypothetical protein